MSKRIHKLTVTVAALAALSLGGAVLAQAQSRGHARHHAALAASSTTAGTADADNVQSGDQTAPDNGAASEQIGAENPEQPGAGSESASGSDGPGGHADEPGNANADHQFQGNE